MSTMLDDACEELLDIIPPKSPLFWILLVALAIYLVVHFSSCKEPQVKYPQTVVYTSEQACQEVVTRGRIRIDSFIMLRCQTTDTAVWRKFEDSIQKEIAHVFHEIDTSNGNYFKYLNTHYAGKKIPCAIGDSVNIFYKLTPQG